MHSSLFLKLFPPPRFMMMKHAGLDISDDAIRCLEYRTGTRGLTIQKFASVDVPSGVMDAGDIKDEKALNALLSKFDRDNNLSYVKVSLPEEKAYLFETEVAPGDIHAIAQNIEFKLEENVPLSAADAVFYFDLLPASVTGNVLTASVSVVPRTYIEHLLSMLRGAGIFPVAFEVVPKSIARAVIDARSEGAVMLIHIMSRKTGIYIVCGGVVCFTSTVGWGSHMTGEAAGRDISVLTREINRIYTYWSSHRSSAAMTLKGMVLAGRNAPEYENALRGMATEAGLTISVADVWKNSFSIDAYIPPISRADSLDYAVAAGLALD